MGTRADFYIKKADEKPVWVGSIAWDGYPGGIDDENDYAVLKATTEEEFKERLSKFFSTRDDLTLPEAGWPWPWNDSRTTDYAYIFSDGKVMASCFGRDLFDPLNPPEEQEDSNKMNDYFPDMSAFKNVRYDKGSGAIFITVK